MAERRGEIENFVARLIAEVEAAEAAGMTAPDAIADHFNANGLTTRKGRPWSGRSMAKFLLSPGAKRYRSASRAAAAPKALDQAQLQRLSETTIGHYERAAVAYHEGTQDHDVSQNTEAFLVAIKGEPPYAILDLGCGPGRDLRYFRSLGHAATGLEGSRALAAMARRHSGAKGLQQDFLAMELPASRFDGVFANASLFHVPSQELPRILLELYATLKPRGVLFASNPHGNNEEGLRGDRYGCFFDLATWRNYLTAAGFSELQIYYRPPGLPRHQQPWLASLWRKGRNPT